MHPSEAVSSAEAESTTSLAAGRPEADPPALPRISVVIPSYQQGRYLEACLLSVLGQGYPDLEVLVLDGGSTDNTRDILRRYAPSLAFWRSEPDSGQAQAINEGMSRASGEVFCWLNSDDLHLPGALLRVGRHFAEHPDGSLVYGGAVAFSDHPEPLIAAALPSRPFSRTELTQSDYVIQPSSFWHRDLWTQVGPLDPTLHYVLDWEWYLRASRISTFTYLPYALSLYRFHPQHKTSGGGAGRRREIMNLVREHADEQWVRAYSDADQVLAEREHLVKRIGALGLGRRRVGRLRAAGAATAAHVLLNRRTWPDAAARRRAAVALRSLSPDEV